MNGNELAQALRAGDRVYGTCVLSPAPQWPPMIAGAGLDFVFLDTEHAVLNRTELSWMCQAYSGQGLAPIVRIPSPDPYLACQVLDGGAAGVIAPYVESVEQVQQHRGAVKLRPLKGDRLQRALSGKEKLNGQVQKYLESYNQNNVCIINIESVPALEALDEIVAVPGVDALLVGPHDLSINLGIPEQYSHPRFEEAIQTIIRKGRDAGLGVGIHFSDGMEPLIGWAKAGMNLIIHSSDMQIVRQTLAGDISRLRTELGDARKGGSDEPDMDV
ncbi:MAG: aldolase [Planctomycetes bacterium]|nr:aldolase [Planctomycetota bacterium]